MNTSESRARIIAQRRGSANQVWLHMRASQLTIATANDPRCTFQSYMEIFREPTQFPSEAALEQYSEHFGQVFCPACVVPPSANGKDTLRVHRLFVTIGPDPLGNERDQAWCVCHGCGFEEYHSIEKEKRPDLPPQPTAWQQAQQQAQAQAQAQAQMQQAKMWAQAQAQAQIHGQGGAQAANPGMLRNAYEAWKKLRP